MTPEEIKEKLDAIKEEDNSWYGHEEGYMWEDAFEHYQDLYFQTINLLNEIVKGVESK